jgi:hypothetical protein
MAKNSSKQNSFTPPKNFFDIPKFSFGPPKGFLTVFILAYFIDPDDLMDRFTTKTAGYYIVKGASEDADSDIDPFVSILENKYFIFYVKFLKIGIFFSKTCFSNLICII